MAMWWRYKLTYSAYITLAVTLYTYITNCLPCRVQCIRVYCQFGRTGLHLVNGPDYSLLRSQVSHTLIYLNTFVTRHSLVRAKGEVLVLLYVFCSVNDFSPTHGPIHAKVCMRPYSGSGCVFSPFGVSSPGGRGGKMGNEILDLSLSLRRTLSTRPLTNTHDWPAASASEATALRRYTNLIIIIIIIISLLWESMGNFCILAVFERYLSNACTDPHQILLL